MKLHKTHNELSNDGYLNNKEYLKTILLVIIRIARINIIEKKIMGFCEHVGQTLHCTQLSIGHLSVYLQCCSKKDKWNRISVIILLER